MSKYIDRLQAFLPVKAYEKISSYDENLFDILDAATDEEIGNYYVNDKGDLSSFSFLEKPAEGNVTKEEMAALAKRFTNTFYPGQTEYELSAILDLDNPYMVVFEKREKKYGLFLHSSGFTITISTAGQITGFYYADEEFEIRYPDRVITEEEALETYVKGLDFELSIQQFDKDVYKNGDHHYHLAYSVVEYIMDIPADGSEPASFREEFELEPTFIQQQSPGKEIYELVGLSTEYRLLETKLEEGKRIEVWSKRDGVDSYSFEMEEADNHVVKLCFDDKTGILLHLLSGEEFEAEGEEISLESAKEIALDMIFQLFPDTHERFRLEILDDNEEEADFDEDEIVGENVENDEEFTEDDFDEDVDWDEEYIEEEPSYTFYFHLYHNGLRVDQHVSMLRVGKSTGKVTHLILDVPSYDLYGQLPTKPVISKAEAKKIYQKNLKLDLMFTREYDEDEKSIYSLAYVPSFPASVGHVRAIDAVSGEAIFVDVGDATFFD
ncbi:YcdB/YcdC domain-containing protein [Ferdinandcohnia sp. Marseille-Q9671]